MELFGTLKAKVEGYVGSDIEKKVKEATGPENWNVSNTLKNEIASATFRYAQFKEIMPIIWDRLDSDPVLWRMIIKSLTLIEHLMRLGSEWVLEDVRDHIYRIRSLNHFRYTDDDGNEYGSGIRETSKKIADYLKNPETLKEAREASASTSGSNYVGMSSSGSMSRSSHQSSGRSTYGGYGSETQSSTRNASSYPAPRSYQQESSQSHAQRTSSSTAYGYPAPPQSQVSRPTENSATRQSKVEKPIASKPKPKATTTGAIKVSAKPITESPANLVALAPPPGETSLASSANKPQADPFSALDQATTNDDDGFDEIVNFESAPTDTSASNATDDIFGEFASLTMSSAAPTKPVATSQSPASAADPFALFAESSTSAPTNTNMPSNDIFATLATGNTTNSSNISTNDPFMSLSQPQNNVYAQQQAYGQYGHPQQQQMYGQYGQPQQQQMYGHQQPMYAQQPTYGQQQGYNSYPTTNNDAFEFSAPQNTQSVSKDKQNDPFANLSW